MKKGGKKMIINNDEWFDGVKKRIKNKPLETIDKIILEEMKKCYDNLDASEKRVDDAWNKFLIKYNIKT
jgi:hypothetical protein